MNPSQRVSAVLQGRLPDRVPLFVMSRHWALHHAGLTFEQCLADASGELYARAQAQAYALFEYDGVMDLEGVSAESEVFGCRLATSADNSPTVRQPLIGCPEDMATLKVPGLDSHPVVERQLNVVRCLRRTLGADVPIYANVQCPFRSAAMLRGIENLLLDLYERPGHVHALLKKTTRMAIAYGRALADSGTVLMPSNPLGARNIMSRQHYNEFVFPYDREMVAAFGRRHIPTVLHICGDVNDRLDLIAASGYDGVSLDSAVDLMQAKRQVGERICLIGNVDVFKPLRDGRPEQVAAAAGACLAAAAGGRFMLSAGCEVIRDTPAENIRALVNAGRAHAYR